MHKSKSLLSLLVLATAASIYSATPTTHAPTTQVPFTYVIDYTSLQAANPDFREHFSSGVPTLYHPGPDLRYLGRFGMGSTVYDYRNVPYETFERQTKDYLQFLRQKGVRWITPYLCNQTISGNDVHRYGVWEVYDRWQDFNFLGLGPKPADPITWMQREPSGNLHYNYKRKCFLERHDDDLQIRYAPCPNNQDWRNLCNAEAMNAARLGCDGLFIDNNIIHCYCPSCKKRFQKYLQEKYSAEEFFQAFGTRNYSEVTLYKEGDLRYWARTFPEFIPWLEKKYPPADRGILFDTRGPLDPVHVDAAGGGALYGETAEFIARHVLPQDVSPTFENLRLANPALQTSVGRLRWAETMMFWAHSIGEQLAEMREAGRRVNPNFFLIPNWGVFQRIEASVGRAEDGKDMRRWRRGATWQMYEEDSATGIIAPGVVLDYDLELRYAFACGVRAMLLPYTLADADIEEVQHAEAAASGGSVFVTTFRNPQVRERYRDFFEKHSDLYEGYRSAAKVAMAFFFDQGFYLNLEHFRQVHALNRFLADQQIPFDQIIEEDLNDQRLADYRVVILPNIEFMSDQQIAAVRQFIDSGGMVIAIGAIGKYDLFCRPRTGTTLQPRSSGSLGLTQYTSLQTASPCPGIELEEGLQAARDLPMSETWKNDKNARYRLMAELDKAIRFKRYQEPNELAEVISKGLGYNAHIMNPQQAGGIRHTLWMKAEKSSKRIVLHLVNKNVPLAEPPEKRVLPPVENLQVTIPIPKDEAIVSVKLWSPGEQNAMDLGTNAQKGEVHFTVPTLQAYALIEIKLE